MAQIKELQLTLPHSNMHFHTAPRFAFGGLSISVLGSWMDGGWNRAVRRPPADWVRQSRDPRALSGWLTHSLHRADTRTSWAPRQPATAPALPPARRAALPEPRSRHALCKVAPGCLSSRSASQLQSDGCAGKCFSFVSLIRETRALQKASLILCCSRLLEFNTKPRRKRAVRHMAL